jgi:hypothetical protein
LGSDFETSREVRIVADAGPLGYLPIAAHGHADALSFTLSTGGRELLVDPGTYAYHTDRTWRDYFRGTTAHNTLCIDGENQSVSSGNFLWTRHACVTLEKFEVTADRQQLVASHDGYRGFRTPAVHRRSLVYDCSARTLYVDDEVTGCGARLVELHWHFGERCQIEMQADHARVEHRDRVMILRWPAGFTARLVCGQTDPPLGWISRRFDAKAPCQVLALNQPLTGNWRGQTVIKILAPDDNEASR